MTDLELIFTMLGEKVTTEITRSKEAKNFPECKTAAREGGGVAGNESDYNDLCHGLICVLLFFKYFSQISRSPGALTFRASSSSSRIRL